MKNIITAAKEMAAKISDSVASIRRAGRDTEESIRALHDERARLLASPVTREDYTAMVHAQIDARADYYRERVVNKFMQAITGTHGVVNAARVVGAPATVSYLAAAYDASRGYSGNGAITGDLRGAMYDGDYDNRPLGQLAATFLLRDQMKAAATEAILAITPWPHEDAKPVAESRTRLGEIETELAGLSEQLESLRADAASIGIPLNGQESNQSGPEADKEWPEEFYARAPDGPDTNEWHVEINGTKFLRHVDPKTGKHKDRLLLQ